MTRKLRNFKEIQAKMTPERQARSQQVADQLMRVTMKPYRSYEPAGVQFDPDSSLFTGTVDTRDVITFVASSPEGLQKAFEDSVDDYLELCKTRGEQPEKP